MSKEKNESVQSPQEAFSFKPIAGIQPFVYVPSALIALLAFFLFWLFLLPGIRNYGSVVHFSTYPQGAAVYIDGVYKGASPFDLQLDSGTYEYTIETPFYSNYEGSIDVGGKLFASRFFPRRQQVEIQLELNDPQALAQDAVTRFAELAIVGDETNRFRFSPELYTASHRLMLAGFQEEAGKMLSYSLHQVWTPDLARDFCKAASRYESGILSASALAGLIKHADTMIDNSDVSVLWLARIMPSSLRNNLRERSDYQQIVENISSRMITSTSPHGFGPAGLETRPVIQPTRLQFRAARQEFRFMAVPATDYLHGAATGQDPASTFPRHVFVDQFYMLDQAVSVAQYAAIMGIEDESSNVRTPQTMVAYPDAQAFAQKLNTLLPTDISREYRVALPTSEQWEVAARWNGDPLPDAILYSPDQTGPQSGGNSRGNLGIADLYGNVFEWTRSWFIPAQSYFLDAGYPESEDTAEWSYSERIVRGASWQNRASEIHLEDIGTQAEESKTDYLGFRLVLEKR